MVRSWLLRIVFLTISFNSCLFPPITWGQGDQTLAVLGKIPTDRIIDQPAVSPNPILAGGRAGISKYLSTESRSIGGDSNWRILIPLIFKNWSPEIQQPNPVPEITALDPNRASRGSAGGLLTITGRGFIHSSAIYFNTHLLPAVFIDEHHLQAVIPPGVLTAAGDFPVVVSNPSPQGGPSNSLSFEVSNPIPVLSSFSPESIKAGSPSFTLILTGSDFESAATVQFNHDNVPATRVSDSRIEAVIPAEAIRSKGNYSLVVFNPAPGGGASEALIFPVVRASNVALLPDGSFGKPYEDLFPADATIPSYDPKRFSLITGLVHDVSGKPLSGVTVSVQGHPEYGTASTDSGGRFSLPLNGGAPFTVAYQKIGFLTAHRQVEAGWNTIATAETPVLVVEDAAATAITFDGNAATILRHTSSTVSDAFGSRSLTMVFSGNNRALVTDAQGNEQVVPQITVRATEFTTPESMPAKLPPTSAFTYCAELSVDGAKNVRFEKPVVVWVDNFLGFNVGEVVPVGFYDRDRAVWVPSKNGVVVRLVDTNGDGIVDAYTDGQNQYLAEGLTDPGRYVPGSTFWRVELSHFTPWDCNWPAGPPADAIAPNPVSPPILSQEGRPCEITSINSYVENQSCIFHEDIPVPGTDLILHYAGNRAPGFKPRVTIPASGPSVPISLKQIIVKMTVAGKTFETALPRGPNQRVEFDWDGLDYLGREVSGSVPATISIGFVYQAFYYSSFDSIAPAFARAGKNITGVWARQEITSWKQSTTTLHRGRAAVLAEAWTLSAHHTLDPNGPDTLLKGDGKTIKHNTLVIDTLAGNGQEGYSGDGGPAAQATFRGPSGLAVDSAGNIFIAEYYNSVVRKVDTRGIITTIAGNGQNGFSGDGGPATQARLYAPRKIALDNAGNIYLVDGANHRIRKVDPAGIITTVAGKNDCVYGGGYSGDGGPATQACLGDLVFDLALDGAGNIYIVDGRNNLIRKVDTSGIITTIAGNGQYGFSGDGGPATLASLSSPKSVAVDNGGNLYLGEGLNSNRIRKVNTSGIISTFAGNGQTGVKVYSGDGGPAIQAGITSPSSLGIDRVGNVYLSSEWDTRIRKVNTQGIITTVAGKSQEGFSGDGGPAVQANLKWPFSLALDSPGNIYVTDWGNQRVRKIFRPGAFKSFVVAGDMTFAEENGWGHVMSSTGLHQSTIDLAGGKTLRTFGYDQADKLVSISDRFGNQTTIQRNGSGVPLSITAPDGIVTRLTVDGNNHLVSVIYPDNAAYTFVYSPDGLLTEKVDPRGNRFGQQYDATGLITHVSDPEGGSWDFSRTVDNAGYTSITLQTAEGQATTYQDRTDSTGAYTSKKTDPAGSVSTFTRSADDLFETEQTSCGLNRTRKYDLDPAYQFKYLQESTQSSPAGLTQTILDHRTYLDTNGDKIPDRITKTLNLNGRNWILINDALTGTETGTSPLGRTVTRTYDPLTLLNQNLSVPGLLPVSYGYDTRGRLSSTSTGSRTSGITYDSQGNVAGIVTSDGKTLHYSYDAMGRLKTQTLPDNSLIAYDYDLNGNLTVLTNPRNSSHGFDYNGINLRRTMATPLSGNYQYTYDKERNLKSILFPSGRQITNTYITSLLRSTTTPEGVTSYSYTCGSNLQDATRGTEKVAYTYDGSLLKTDTRTGLMNQTIGYTYNNDFMLSSLSYAGASQPFNYDNDGLLTGAGSFTITRNTQNGLPFSVTDGTLVQTRTFSGYGELDGIGYSAGSINKYSYNLTRDLAGRITQKAETFEWASETYDYAYDANGRLTEVKKNGSVVETYTYDANGNRLTEVNTLRGLNRSYIVSIEDHLITAGSETYQFDADGFLTSKTLGANASTYLYSSRGELLSATLPEGTTITYDHDPLGRRIGKRVNGNTTEKYLWKDAITLLAVYDASDNLLLRLNYADGRMPVSMSYGGNTYYLAYDQVGSLRLVTDASGGLIKRTDYDSFGNLINDTNPGMNIPFGFAGGLHDQQTGLVRFGARDYDPAIGRWTAKDPIDFGSGDTNLYGYVEGNPIGKVDASGLFPGPCGNENNRWVPDHPFWIFDFTGPCQTHDDCYGCKGKEKENSKSRCDFDFWKNMQIVCSKYILDPHLYLYCQTAATIYYNAVFWGGKSAFEQARKEKCDCP